jgi:hypothetical protein
MGKSEDQIKKRAKDLPKSPISPIWLGTAYLLHSAVYWVCSDVGKFAVLLGFVVFGGLIFEVISRIFLR